MKTKLILLSGILLLFVSCNTKTEVKEGPKQLGTRQLAGAPYEVTMDSRAKEVEKFIRVTEKDLGEVARYRRQIVKGTNHYFEFTKEGKPPVEVLVYQDLKGNLTITSKGILE